MGPAFLYGPSIFENNECLSLMALMKAFVFTRLMDPKGKKIRLSHVFSHHLASLSLSFLKGKGRRKERETARWWRRQRHMPDLIHFSYRNFISFLISCESQSLAGSERTDQRSQPTDDWHKRLLKRKWKIGKMRKETFTLRESRSASRDIKPRQLFFFHNLFGSAEAVSWPSEAWLHEVIVSFPRVDGVSMISVAIKVLRTEPQLNGHRIAHCPAWCRSTLDHTLSIKKKRKSMRASSLETCFYARMNRFPFSFLSACGWALIRKEKRKTKLDHFIFNFF